MSWFDRVLDAVQVAAVIGERVERLGNSVGDMAAEMRDLDRRLSRLEGAYAATRERPGGATALPSPED